MPGLAAALLLLTAAARGGEPKHTDGAAEAAIQLSADGSRVEVVGLPPDALAAIRDARLTREQWQRILVVAVDSDGAAGLSMFGNYAIDGDMLAFAPRFPLRPGLDYRAVFDPAEAPLSLPSKTPRLEATLTPPQPPAAAPTMVVAVYPSGDELPENLLKFYVHFSAPMRRGDDYRHVRILDATGAVVPDAFLELPEELWDAGGTRLTLLFDPGRIKRGLKPNEEVGSPLLAGRSYALVVDAGWRDRSGNSLARPYRKEFRVAAPDNVQPDPRQWKLSPPKAGTRDPLVVRFNEPLDHALLQHAIEVHAAGGRTVDGEVSVDQQERRWQFRPVKLWRPGDFRLVVDPNLEDRAGNSVGRAYEVPTVDESVGVSSSEPVELPFKVDAASP